jgi:hypothetical protein
VSSGAADVEHAISNSGLVLLVFLAGDGRREARLSSHRAAQKQIGRAGGPTRPMQN